MKVKAWAAACLCAAAVTTASAQVDDRGSRETLLEALRGQRAAQEAERFAPAPSLAAPSARARRLPLEGEQPCITLQGMVVRGLDAAARPLQQEFEAFAGRCIGAASLEALHHNLELRLIEAGWITSRVLLPEQSLADGEVEVRVQPGRIDAIVAADPDDGRQWRHALAFDAGDVLEVHQLDAALDHFNRLGGAPARFRLEPGAIEGTTHVVLVRGAPAAPRAVLAADNGGTREFGRAQIDLDLLLDEPLGLLDQLRLTVASNAELSSATSRSAGLHYSLPWGRHLLSLGATAAWRRQPVRGTTVEFESRGNDRGFELRWDWAVWRSGEAKAGPWAAWRDRRSRSSLDGTELVVQRRHRLQREIGFQWWRQTDTLRWLLEASHTEGRRHGAPNPFVPNDGGRSRSDLVGTRLTVDPDGGWPGWQLELRAQHGRKPGSGADLFVIGSAGTVRGHGADAALASESGALARLDISWPAAGADAVRWQPYAGWDIGVLRGAMAAALPGRRLAGLTAGVRLAVAGSLQADLSLSRPLDGPPGTHASRWRPAIAVRQSI